MLHFIWIYLFNSFIYWYNGLRHGVFDGLYCIVTYDRCKYVLWKSFLSSIPYIIWLNSPVASFKLICISRLFPSNRINEWKENSIHNFRTFRNFFDINSLSLLFISDIYLIFNCEYIQYLWFTILLNYTNI